MIRGLAHHLFRVPVQAGPIEEVLDHGQRLLVGTRDGGRVEIALTPGLAKLRRPKRGDYLVEYPGGQVAVLTPEEFALKAAAGVGDE